MGSKMSECVQGVWHNFIFEDPVLWLCFAFDTISFSKIQCCGSARVWHNFIFEDPVFSERKKWKSKCSLCASVGADREHVVQSVRVNGEMFKLFKEEVDCHTRRLFDTIDVSVHNVYEQLQNRIKGDEVADIWAMEHVLFGQTKLAKTKSCIPRILHWMHVKVGEAKVEKAFSFNEVITEVYVSKEEMYIDIVKEALDGHHNGRVKDNLHRQSIADIVAENEALRTIIIEQEVSIAKLEKVVQKLEMIRSKKRQRKVYDARTPIKKSKLEKDDDISADDVGKSNSKEDNMLGDEFGSLISQKDNQIVLYGAGKSNSKKYFDMEGDVVDKIDIQKAGDVVEKIDIEKSGNVLVDEEMDIQKSNINPRDYKGTRGGLAVCISACDDDRNAADTLVPGNENPSVLISFASKTLNYGQHHFAALIWWLWRFRVAVKLMVVEVFG
ncbi:hypothetical protein V8G54_006736 [Vigna mungo]|uniref:Uncharacterized protein n=1 Tax=Vigna mungo TaxID=3915 RepID=A0AAQ3S8D4_VIGMU